VPNENSSAPSSALITHAAGLQAAVGAQPHPPAQAVQHQRLLRLGQAQLPVDPGVLDRGERRGGRCRPSCRDQDYIGAALATPAAIVRARLGHQLDDTAALG